mmetsp:Transcript_11648/g.49794  ORF Transcript_11648/g.49794 Transcript_11648/m.49794 type:complete len:216 (-) Transcript_11648:3926-4573(-)
MSYPSESIGFGRRAYLALAARPSSSKELPMPSKDEPMATSKELPMPSREDPMAPPPEVFFSESGVESSTVESRSRLRHAERLRATIDPPLSLRAAAASPRAAASTARNADLPPPASPPSASARRYDAPFCALSAATPRAADAASDGAQTPLDPPVNLARPLFFSSASRLLCSLSKSRATLKYRAARALFPLASSSFASKDTHRRFFGSRSSARSR